MRLITIFILLFPTYFATGQTLSLEDIFNVRTMDSIELLTFSHKKGFELREVKMDIWRSIHKYYSTDSLISFQRNFPTGKKLFPQDTATRDNGMVY